MIGLLTYFSDEYSSMASITNKNKREYCEKHTYAFNAVKAEIISTLPFDKYAAMEKLLQHCEWIWYTGVDSLITNFNKKIEWVCDDTFDCIITVDRNGINSDSLLVRNSEAGFKLLQHVLSLQDMFMSIEKQFDQGALNYILHNSQYKFKVLPQRVMNSYDYTLYGGSNRDTLGELGQWEKGDLLIHWPAVELGKRLRLIQEKLTEVIK